jgi:small subunit ribosomal protein S2
VEQTNSGDPESKAVEENTATEDQNRDAKLELARKATKEAIEQGHLALSTSGPLNSSAKPGFPEARVVSSADGSAENKSREFANSKIIGTIDSYKDNQTRGIMSGENKEVSAPVEVTLRTLLEAGAHFGHQTSRWNPAMAPYIYGSRNGIHIINLPKTVQAWSRSKAAIEEMAAQGGTFLFVGTKKQAQDPVGVEAARANSFYVAERWLGGMLTNFSTVRKSVDRMKKIEETLKVEDERMVQGLPPKFTKKERLMFTRELKKLDSSIGGIKEMTGHPSMLFVIDIKREEIAIKEANRLDIPVVALVDTNCDPSAVQYPIPSNDDGTRAITLFCKAVADSILAGKKRYVPKPFEARSDLAGKREDRKDTRGNRNKRPRGEGPKVENKTPQDAVIEPTVDSEVEVDANATI